MHISQCSNAKGICFIVKLGSDCQRRCVSFYFSYLEWYNEFEENTKVIKLYRLALELIYFGKYHLYEFWYCLYVQFIWLVYHNANRSLFLWCIKIRYANSGKAHVVLRRQVQCIFALLFPIPLLLITVTSSCETDPKTGICLTPIPLLLITVTSSCETDPKAGICLTVDKEIK